MLTVLILAAAMADAACPTDRQPQTREALVQVEHDWNFALETRDTKALGCLLDPGFTDFSWRGERRTRAQVLAALPQRKDGTITLQELDLRVEGAMGVVRGIAAGHSPSGQPTGKARFTDLFLYRHGRWSVIAAQETGMAEGA